jgi:predicted phosphate transport protein (TIGR00153 family)
MRLRLAPRDDTFCQMFVESALHLVTATDQLAEFVQENADRAALAASLKELEHTCDAITHRVINELNSTFVTPFDREDIHQLAVRLDDVMDAIEQAADFAVLTGLGPLPAEMFRQAELLQAAARTAAEAMPKLSPMRNLGPYFVEANRLENEADQVYRALLSRLFGGEFDALAVLKLKQVADDLEDAADAFEDVAGAVEAISVKES